MSLAVLADHMASKGRGPDSMLIHMSPREVQGLQALAMEHGGSLTINPDTGLPEAGFLDKLLPTIIGAGLTLFGGVPPNVAAAIVGGIQTVRTGDIGKGISAGLGAYGGAGMTAGMTTAGADAIGGQAASAAKGLTGDMAFNLADAGSSLSNALEGGEMGVMNSSTLSNEAIKDIQQGAAERAAAASPYEKLSAGFDAAKANPSSLLTKDNFKYMAAAAAPILADQAVKSNLPTTTTKPGMIRPYSFDPYGGTYTAGTPYEAVPKKAASGGIMGFDESSNSPMSRQSLGNMQDAGGMFNFAHDGGGVMKMAEGGIAGYALGGTTAADLEKAYVAAQQSGNYGAVNDIINANHVTEADIQNQWKGLDTSGLAGLGVNLAKPYENYTDAQIGNFFATNPDANIGESIKTYNADPTVVNRYLSNIAAPFVGSTEDKGGSGTLGIYNQLTTEHIDPNEFYAARIANDPNYAGWTKDMITRGYALDKGALALAAAEKDGVSDKEWVNFMDTNNYSINDMAQSFGLSLKEVRDRYNAVKNAEKKVTGTGGTGGTGTTTTQAGYGTGGSGYTGRLEDVLGASLPPGVSGAGITTVNPNGTITTRPNTPGIPEGGFTGMTDLRNAYTKGGGSLGYIPYAPKTIDEFNAKYKNTGGSKQAMDYLTGKTAYSATPYTPTGELQKPYWESVGRFPENRSTKKYVFVDGKYQLNPDYVKPSYVLAGEKAAALTNKDTKPTYDPGAGNVWVWNSTASKWEAQPVGGSSSSGSSTGMDSSSTGGEANGGLMADGGLAALTMAGGGQFDLGSYSDGGRLLRGPGDGVSDSIPATIGNKRPARLADGEFVVPARIVSELGNGSTEAGARKLYAMMDRVQAARKGSIGKGKVAKNSRADKYLPA